MEHGAESHLRKPSLWCSATWIWLTHHPSTLDYYAAESEYQKFLGNEVTIAKCYKCYPSPGLCSSSRCYPVDLNSHQDRVAESNHDRPAFLRWIYCVCRSVLGWGCACLIFVWLLFVFKMLKVNADAERWRWTHISVFI